MESLKQVNSIMHESYANLCSSGKEFPVATKQELILSTTLLSVDTSKLPSDWLTPHIVFVRAIQLFDSSVAEGQFPHPVDPTADARSQAQVGAGCSCMEAISCKTVSTVNNNDMFYLKNLLC